MHPPQEHRSPRRHSCWELELRDCGAIPGWGLLLTVGRHPKGTWGGRLWWETPVEESQAAMEARRYHWVMHRGWSQHHRLSLPTSHHQQVSNRDWPFKPLTWGATGKDPRMGSPPSSGWATEKDCPETFWSPAARGYTKTLIGPQLLWLRQSMSLNTWCHLGPPKLSSCTILMLDPHWGRVAPG